MIKKILIVLMLFMFIIPSSVFYCLGYFLRLLYTITVASVKVGWDKVDESIVNFLSFAEKTFDSK